VELAPGVFFLQGRETYFRSGTTSGPAGAIRTLMCNNGWVVLGDEVLLVDANMPDRADELLALVAQTTKKPVRYVVNTHHHGDHIYGNRIVRERTGAEIIGCTAMVEELRRYETGAFGVPPGRWEQVAQQRPDVARTPLLAPTRTFDSQLAIRGAGGMRVELLHLGRGHTRGDTVVWLPRERIAFLGDLAANGPYNIVRDSDMAAWPHTLAAIEALGPQIICAGHGAPASVALLASQAAFFRALWREVERRAGAGLSCEAVVGDLGAIRAALLADPTAAHHVIPAEADLPVLSLRAQVERTYDQIDQIIANTAEVV
jgi:glyoxylase-like metal-dependent hydrolase (beta-lactamase superfamily II)